LNASLHEGCAHQAGGDGNLQLQAVSVHFCMPSCPLPNCPLPAAATALRTLHLNNVVVPANLPWSSLTALSQLTSLKLCGVGSYSLHSALPGVLARLPALQRLTLNDARSDTIAEISTQLTELVLKMAPGSGPAEEHLSRLTCLHRRVLSADGRSALAFAWLTDVPDLVLL